MFAIAKLVRAITALFIPATGLPVETLRSPPVREKGRR
jgi:hypothetical protein